MYKANKAKKRMLKQCTKPAKFGCNIASNKR